MSDSPVNLKKRAFIVTDLEAFAHYNVWENSFRVYANPVLIKRVIEILVECDVLLDVVHLGMYCTGIRVIQSPIADAPEVRGHIVNVLEKNAKL